MMIPDYGHMAKLFQINGCQIVKRLHRFWLFWFVYKKCVLFDPVKAATIIDIDGVELFQLFPLIFIGTTDFIHLVLSTKHLDIETLTVNIQTAQQTYMH